MARTEVSIASLLGSSEAMLEVREFALTAARVNAPVLILGETGTGKSLVSRVIHSESPRARGPYQAVNCAGIPDTLFESEFFGHQRGAFTGAREGRRGVMEQADRGTLLLDEVGELSLSQQAKLLIALEEGEIRRLGGEGTVRLDLRLISASSRRLSVEVQKGGFRRDLFHRLAVLCLHLPPLRSRIADIPLLAQSLLKVQRVRHGRPGPPLSRECLSFLETRDWPGNVRELGHVLEAALILSQGPALDVETLEKAQTMGGTQRRSPAGVMGKRRWGKVRPRTPRQGRNPCRDGTPSQEVGTRRRR